MYQRVGPVAYKKDLGNTLALCDALDNPQTRFKSIHVAGTNGKGSCSHILSAVFQANGYKTGLYTSPHLVDFRERIRINGKEVSEHFVIDFVKRIKPQLDNIKPSFFEITVGMAFDYFAQEGVDIAIIETGLGGRLDSTNVILPEACLITNIGLDHTDMLGNTLSQIAAEKAGIIKDLTPVVIGEHQGDISYVFESRANAKSADLYYAKSLVEEEDLFQTDLLGSYQRKNVRSTMALLNIMLKRGWSLEQDKVRHAYANVASLTGLKGRWQVVSESPRVICDTGHNVEGISELMRQLKGEKYNQLHIVFGQVSGKNSKQVLRLLPKDANYYFCQPSVIRALSVHELNKVAEDAGLEGYVYETVSGAYQAAQEKASEEDVIFVGGSTFVVADFLATLV